MRLHNLALILRRSPEDAFRLLVLSVPTSLRTASSSPPRGPIQGIACTHSKWLSGRLKLYSEENTIVNDYLSHGYHE